MDISTREQWIEFAGGLDEAAKYEALFLSAPRERLPTCALRVLALGDEAADADYWAFLATQWLDYMWPPSSTTAPGALDSFMAADAAMYLPLPPAGVPSQRRS